ncbi:TetR family transcriptional regulator [Endozoicomonas sp. G2_2]|uniref:TetR family transcriptional regulator n=1 Tax=Endozoicomonas sp. G2_2 TaxID=2821092 RepID=UPI001ADB1E0B|nr:TetR family transcriptional regulator [Endozoicomonas sp. G2_2]MBO9469791.1 TetR family transcriptional regulator [Endozoicomonas sp. G2_2]
MARRTKDESAQTRERILDAAEIEMQARGVSQTSLDRIAKRAQVTRGAIYWHFADKRALLEAMVSRTHLPLRDLCQCLSQHIPGSEPLRLLREMMRHGLERLGNDAQHRTVCHIVMHRCEVTEHGHPADALMRAMFEDARAVLLSLCNEIAELGQLRDGLDARDATHMIMAFMCGNYECVLRHPETYDAERDWRPLIDALLRGIFDTSSLPDGQLTPRAREAVCRSTGGL